MNASIKSEIRKLISVRSTYILSGLAFLYMVLFDFYIIGIRAADRHRESFVNYHNPLYLMSHVGSSGGIAAPVLFIAIIGVLLMAHEYRYNTIMYTLTSSNSRVKSLLSKVIVFSAFSVLAALVIGVLSPALARLGLKVGNISTGPQIFFYRQYFARLVFYSWAYSMIALLLAIYFRNIVASIVSLFLIPITIEPLLGLLLSSYQQQFLPFTALSGVVDNGIAVRGPSQLTSLDSVFVVLGYLLIGWIIAFTLFLKRDAVH